MLVGSCRMVVYLISTSIVSLVVTELFVVVAVTVVGSTVGVSASA